MNYPDYFKKATGGAYSPYPYQQKLAEGQQLPSLLRIPTGAGKTEATILAWLYRRFEHTDGSVRNLTPRRLAYCLPMRTLVEQTTSRAGQWLDRLELTEQVGIVTLMGGEPREQWWLYPEKPFIIAGTQDMLLSRALNRGYGSNPPMWPIEYGLLNNDCLWIIDEVQLMRNGLPTSTQLAGLRTKLQTFGPTRSVWMSATVKPQWLATVDHPAPPASQVMELGPADMAHPDLAKRHNADKRISQAVVDQGRRRHQDIAGLIADKHIPGTLTLAIVNTVERAQEVYRELGNSRRVSLNAEKVLVHSRFRETDRQKKNADITADVNPSAPGVVVVATQAVEAGVDLSARTLITELAPWSSMVQRFGRCNRRGDDDTAHIFWVDAGERNADTAPYQPAEVAESRKLLKEMEGQSVGPAALEKLNDSVENPEPSVVIRRRDLTSLFDTTPDLSGSYLDVSQYVRGSEEREVSVFWRKVPPEGPTKNEPKARHSETVNVPCGKNVTEYLKVPGRKAWRWDFLDDEWLEAREQDIHPGMTLLLDAGLGGYSAEIGWEPANRQPVEPIPDLLPETEDGQSSDPWSFSRKPVTLSDHCRHVEDAVKTTLDQLSAWSIEPSVRQAVELAALYHDAGKAHPAFQRMMHGISGDKDLPVPGIILAKSGHNQHNERRHFRHELGSALAVLEHAKDLNDATRDLAAYLAAAHHGKVRLAIRSLPGKRQDRQGNAYGNPEHDRLLGYPIAQPETLPAVDLGNGLGIAETLLDLSIARIGLDNQGQRSWLDRATALLERLGPFRLAILETLVRAADMRASRAEMTGETIHPAPDQNGARRQEPEESNISPQQMSLI